MQAWCCSDHNMCPLPLLVQACMHTPRCSTQCVPVHPFVLAHPFPSSALRFTPQTLAPEFMRAGTSAPPSTSASQQLPRPTPPQVAAPVPPPPAYAASIQDSAAGVLLSWVTITGHASVIAGHASVIADVRLLRTSHPACMYMHGGWLQSRMHRTLHDRAQDHMYTQSARLPCCR